MNTRYLKLQSTFIWHPQADITYFILDKNSPTKCVKVTFEKTTALDSVQSYEFTSAKLVYNSGKEGYVSYAGDYLVTHHSLPQKYSGEVPRLMCYSDGQFEILTHVIITVFPSHAKYVYDYLSADFSYRELDANRKKELFQNLGCNIEFGKYPIFLNAEQPSYSRLKEIYQAFYRFNKHQLNNQFEASKDYCHIRAHFISEMLKQGYGISSLKVYKFYNELEWHKYQPARYWKFHCVTMLIDSEQRQWIWDPWPNNAKYLMSFGKWIHNRNEPKATKILICSNVVINDSANGKNFDAPNFIYLNHEVRNVFQKLVMDAMPNHPEKPLQLSRAAWLTLWVKANVKKSADVPAKTSKNALSIPPM